MPRGFQFQLAGGNPAAASARGLPFAVSLRWGARVLLAAVLLLLLSAIDAKAQTCTTTITNTNFGTPNLVTGTFLTTTATLSVSCTGMSGASNNLAACPSFGQGSGGVNGTARTMAGPSGATLNYNLYTDAARTIRWGSLTDASLGSVPRIAIARSGSSGSATYTVQGAIAGGQGSTQPGSYSSSFAGQVSIKYTLQAGCAGTTQSTGTSTFNVLASPVAACTVTAGALSFGARGVVDAAVDATSTLSATCASGLSYSVQLGNGLTGTNATNRLMTNGGRSVVYGLYRDVARTLAWGGAGQAAAGTGTGAAQAYTVYGRVPAQATPAPGAYSDTVVATVVY